MFVHTHTHTLPPSNPSQTREEKQQQLSSPQESGKDASVFSLEQQHSCLVDDDKEILFFSMKIVSNLG